MNDFLPISIDDMNRRGWDELDFVMVTGDAYVDHPSFGAAVISRILDKHDYRVGVIAQPDWTGAAAFRKLGRPRLGFLVTAGNIDSMVNNYTAAKKRRSDDIYAPGRRGGLRPDRAAISYAIRVREAYGRIPIILGGLEASLRRFAHFDYWQEKVRRSLLIDSGADIIVYGMGERAMLEIAAALAADRPVAGISEVPGTVYRTKELPSDVDSVRLPSFVRVESDARAFAESFLIQYRNSDAHSGRILIEEYDDCLIVQNPPSPPLEPRELDEVNELPYARAAHPVYEAAGGVRAIEEVRFSLVSSRGCFGNCSFCSLTFHQGRTVQARTPESLVREAVELTRLPDFKGYIHDVGGPTADFFGPACARQTRGSACSDRECLFPSPCPKLNTDHSRYLELLRRLRSLPGVKKVFIRSGLRFDFILADQSGEFFTELVEHHVSGQLKVAPEHVCDEVLTLMRKPPHRVYLTFKKKFDALNRKLGKKQFLLPYFISSHPGSTLAHAVALACFFRDHRFAPEQVQDFYPTPGTLSTCMYHTGLDPFTMRPLCVAKSRHEKALQRALLQYRNPKNRRLVEEALRRAGRPDLIGFGPQCLIQPLRGESSEAFRSENTRSLKWTRNARRKKKNTKRRRKKN
ncbi:MAG: YgiQ family radical SAM protein [Spirochaetales bacterium]|nr:YgiQ family radical SAM protein [Spirochaetales bacterium]